MIAVADTVDVPETVASVNGILDRALDADRDGRSGVAVGLVALAHEVGSQEFGFDVWFARITKDFPNDWKLRWPRPLRMTGPGEVVNEDVNRLFWST